MDRSGWAEKIASGLMIAGLTFFAACTPASTPAATPTATVQATLRPSATWTPAPTSTPTPASISQTLPLIAAAYHIWHTTDWDTLAELPERGAYDSTDPATLHAQIADMQAMGIRAGVITWKDAAQDADIEALLAASRDEDFYWAIQLDIEQTGDPSAGEVTLQLNHIRTTFAQSPNYLYIDGRPVVFSSVNEDDDGCGMLSRWREGSRGESYLVMQTFPGYSTCSVPPDQWIDFSPESPSDPELEQTLTIASRLWSNGDFEAKQAALKTWLAGTQWLAQHHPQLTLVLSYNDWLAGTNIEPGEKWGPATDFYRQTLAQPAEDHNDLLIAALRDSDAVLVGAGDVALCDSSGAAATAQLLAAIPGTVFMVGDGAYENGSASEYSTCFAPNWGGFLGQMVAAPGERDFLSERGAAFYDYFGTAAGAAGQGYYSFELGSWHIVVLNSVCSYASGCGVNAAQMQWLREDLSQHDALCTAAIWHYPLFSSGQHGGSAAVQPFWDVLYAAGAELVINAHDQDYERFAPMNPQATPDPDNGIREFVVGTGGSGLTGLGDPAPNSEYTIFYTYGVLKLTLKPDSYEWEFVPQAGMGASDHGSGTCH
jgi:hypothetical protein